MTDWRRRLRKKNLTQCPGLVDHYMWPVADHAFDNASYDAFANGYFLSRDMMKWFWNAYTIDSR